MKYLYLLYCLAFWIYVYLAVFVLVKDPRAHLNRACAIFLLNFAWWSFCKMFIHNVYVTKEFAMLMQNINAVAWTSFCVFFLWFILIFTKRESILKSPFFYVPAVMLPLLFLYKQWTGYLIVDFVRVPYGWATIWKQSIWFYLFRNYYTVVMLVGLYLVFDFKKKTHNEMEKKTSRLLLFVIPPVLLFSSATDVFLPKMGIHTVPNIANVIALGWGIGLVYAITKYKFMVFTPAMVAEEIISIMTDSLVLISPEGTILEVNDYTLKLLGYPRKEIVGKDVDVIFSDRGKKFFDKGILKSFPDEKRTYKKETEYQTREKEIIPVSFSGSLLRDKGHNIMGVVGVAHDIRGIKKLIEKEKEISKIVAVSRAEKQKKEELKKAYNKLKETQTMLVQSEKLRALGQLGAGVAHELNSPLAGMLCLVRSFMKKKNTLDDEYKDLKEIEIGCQFMAKIIEDLNEFTKDKKDNYDEVDCNGVIDSTLVLIKSQFMLKGISVIKEYEKDLWQVLGSKRQLQQIVINIMVNAKDAMKKGDKMFVTTKNIQEENGNNYVAIIFRDTGCGMDENTQKKIFENFYTTKTEGEGVGLGLAIVNSIIKECGGSIEVESELGKGSVFTVKFPAKL